MYCMSDFFIKKNTDEWGNDDVLTSDPTTCNFSIYFVIPKKCLLAEDHLSNLQKGSINGPNGTWAIPHLRETASATSRSAMQTFMAALHSGETIRTNCSRVQQSRPGTIIYEPNHLWVPYARTKQQLSACKLPQSKHTHVLSKVRSTKKWISYIIQNFWLVKSISND